MNQYLNDECFIPTSRREEIGRNFDDGLVTDQEWHHLRRRMFYEKNEPNVNRDYYCPCCMSKPPDKQIMFPFYEEPLPPYVGSNPTPGHSLVKEDLDEKDHYPVYMYDPPRMINNEYYYDMQDREYRYEMNYVERDGERSKPYQGAPRKMHMEHNNLYRYRLLQEQTPRFRVNRQSYDKEQLKNDIEELNKDMIEWQNYESKIDKENENELEQTEINYEGLIDIRKTIKKDYNKKKWRKMTQELFNQILEFEKKNPNIKQCEIEKIFLVNRSTYWRWKKRLLS